MKKSIAAITTVVFIVIGAVAVDLYLTKDNVTVSGQAGVTYLPATVIQRIEFQDIQTGSLTTFQFPQNFTSGAGDYTVTLKNGHTYNVYISFYIFGDSKNAETHFSTTFHVNATAGQTAITKTFWYT